MKKNLQTEQLLELDEEQCQAITGAKFPPMPKPIVEKLARIKAQEIQKGIQNNATAGKVVEVDTSWTKRLTS